MKIRPHHVLCAHFFVGKGYSERFVAHMEQTLAELGRDGAAVTLTDGCDELCSACPNNHGGVCETETKVRAIDGRAIAAMQLHFGDTAAWSDLCARAERGILAQGLLREVCGDCEWIDLCAGRETDK